MWSHGATLKLVHCTRRRFLAAQQLVHPCPPTLSTSASQERHKKNLMSFKVVFTLKLFEVLLLFTFVCVELPMLFLPLATISYSQRWPAGAMLP
jgi:hypothetical protein